MRNLTHLQGRNTKVKFMSKILEKIYIGSETGSGSETNWIKQDRRPPHPLLTRSLHQGKS